MAVWVVFALMTAGAVIAVIGPLARRMPPRVTASGETAFYRAQIAEIERDLARGLIAPTEAEAAKAEAARRLLRTVGTGEEAHDLECEPALRRRRAASAIAISTIPLVALALYGALGSPDLPAAPLSARLDADPAKLDLAAAVSRIETHLAQHPDDGRGWEVLAPVYLKSGRSADAVKAYAASLRLNGETAVRLADYGEALVVAAEGIVKADAREAFEKADALDRKGAKAGFYLALAAEQDGDKAGAATRLRELVAGAPSDASWRPAVEERIARLEGAPAPAASLATPEIEAMVENLARRLEEDGSDAEGWLRLVRSYVVLDRPGKAREALAKARKALHGKPEAERLAVLARKLKIETVEVAR